MKTSAALMVVLLWTSLGFSAANKEVLRSLAKISQAKIPRDKLHCEINGINESKTKKSDRVEYFEVTVADFFADYVDWSQNIKPNSNQSFECKGKKAQKCTWAYGEKEAPKSPGWQIVLRFDFDNGKVDPASLECVQVP